MHVYSKTYSKEIYPGVSPFSKAKGFIVIAGTCAEVLPETAVKAYKILFMMKVKISATLIFFFFFFFPICVLPPSNR